MSNQYLSPLAEYINEQLKARSWSQRRLAEAAGISPGGLSRFLRGLSTPETSTIEKLADALGVERYRLLRLLAESHPDAVPEPTMDPEVAYIARRLNELPEDVRQEAVDAVAGVIDVVYTMLGRQSEAVFGEP